jgi:hypothetical protein
MRLGTLTLLSWPMHRGPCRASGPIVSEQRPGLQ